MINNRLIKQIKKHEGLRLKPYLDTATPPRTTIGYGRNLDDQGITEEEAELLLQNDLARVSQELAALPAYQLLGYDVPRQMVLVDMCFNLGLTRLLGFKKFLAALERGDFQTAADEMVDSEWYRQVGNRAKFLVSVMRSGEWQ